MIKNPNTEITDSNIGRNTTYRYIVFAINEFGEGLPTEFIEITIPIEDDNDEKPDGNETTNGDEGEFPVWIIAIFVGVVLILIITGLVFFLMSKKKVEINDDSVENGSYNPSDPFESREYTSIVQDSNISMNDEKYE